MATRVDVLDTADSAAPVTWRVAAMDFGRLLGMALVLSLALGLLLTAAAVVMPAELVCDDAAARRCERPGSGAMMSFLLRRAADEPWLSAPMLDAEVKIDVSGLIARATVVQRFRNGTDERVEGRYVFPLPPHSAIDHLRMRIGERLVEGEIRERRGARSVGEPDAFTASVARLDPGEELVVEVELQQTLDFDGRDVRLLLPLAGARARVEVHLDAGFPIERVSSINHPVVVERLDDTRCQVRLRDDAVPADRDFELLWRPRLGTLPGGVVFLEERGSSTYALFILFPPVVREPGSGRPAREMVFLIDTSRSMEGDPIRQAKAALTLAIARLGPGDRFNVVQFNSLVEPLFDLPRPASARNRARARRFVEQLQTGEGAALGAALEAAFVPADDDLARDVVLLTGGESVGAEPPFATIRQRLGAARLSTVGVGPSPNGRFIARTAELGRGLATSIRELADVDAKMGALLSALDQPALTGMEVSWPRGAAVESWPQAIGDPDPGRPILLSARFEKDGGSEAGAELLTITGFRSSKPWRTRLALAQAHPGTGIAVLWAQRKAQALVDSLLDGADPEEVRAELVRLGLEHQLVTAETSLVAADRDSPDAPAPPGPALPELPLARLLDAARTPPARATTPSTGRFGLGLGVLLMAVGAARALVHLRHA